MSKNNWWIWSYIGDKDSLSKCGFKLTNEQIENYLSAFMIIFNNDWYNSFSENKRERILNNHFQFNCGSYSISWIIRLGECIFNLRKINGFDEEIITRLRDKNNFKSVSIELDYSSCFIQAGMQLKLQPSINIKKGEGKLSINQKSIYFEVIRRDSENYEREEREYTFKILNFLKKKFGSKSTFIRFKKRDSDPEVKLKKFYNILNSFESPFNHVDEDLEIHISNYKGGSTILGNILNKEEKLKSWIKKVNKKYQQLPNNVGGVIIANSSSLWDSKDIKIVRKICWRETKEGQKSRISGIIFCVRQMLGIPSINGERLSCVLPLLLFNKYSKFEYNVELEMMSRAIASFPNWL